MKAASSRWDQIVRAINSSQRVAVTSHIDPDPDAVGSCLALWHGLSALSIESAVVLADPVPRGIRFLPGADRVVILGRGQGLAQAGDGFDLVVVVDCGPERTGGVVPKEATIPVVNIDHHVSNRTAASLSFVEPGASASSELVAQLLRHLSVPLNPSIATCLLTGIVGDTGSFAYSNTSASTLRLAAELVEAGADNELVHQQLFETVPWDYLGLLRRALERVHRSKDGQIAWMELPLQLAREIDAHEQDSEALVRYPRMVSGVEVAMLLREVGPAETKVSFRARGQFDVSKVAERLGGGGHRKAAGCTLQVDLQAAKKMVFAVLQTAEDDSGSR